MKRIYIKIFLGSIFCILTVLTADVKEKMEDDFLRVNDNIQNEEHRDELQALREKFNLERTQIQKYYNEKIETLKEARRGEIKAIKKDFADRREILMKKYDYSMIKISNSGVNVFFIKNALLKLDDKVLTAEKNFVDYDWPNQEKHDEQWNKIKHMDFENIN